MKYDSMKRIVLNMLFVLLCISLSAQQKDQQSGLRSFKVFVPEGEIIQGNRIQVVYELRVTNWSIRSFDGSLECGEIERLDYDKGKLDGSESYIRINVVYRINGAGQLRVNPMSLLVDGKKVVSDSAVINVTPHPRYGSQWIVARDFLAEKGVVAPQLAHKYSTETLCAFSDDKNKCFVITVSESCGKYLDNPVLAYGVGNSMWNGDQTNGDNTIYAILAQYNRQIKHLRDHNEVYSSKLLSNITMNADGVKPLLGSIAYDQDYPYNMLFPKEKYNGKDSSCIAGCGPVALAQILSLYQNDVELKGSTVLTTKSGKRYEIELSDYPVRWIGSERDIASLMLDCAGCLWAEISPYGTASSLSSFKSALINYWGYSPGCRMIKDSKNVDALAIVYSEIDSSRPVVVSDESHIFICDGYDGDYLHFNLGWGGHCNGYYRTLIVPSMSGNQLPFGSILSGIRPLEMEVKMSVDVSEHGTLSTILDESARQKVTSLTVTGQLDGDDIKLLRNMAGAGSEMQADKWYGSLMELDLSGATIKGGTEYLVRKANGIVLKGYQSDAAGHFSYNYNMSEITDQDWDVIISRGLNKLENMLLLKGADECYYASYLTADNVIGDHMFSDCENLTNIILPKNASKIGGYAFHNCTALKTVINRPANVSKTAFQNSGVK